MNTAPVAATHEEICDGALRHYEELAKKHSHWMNTIPIAINFYKRYGVGYENREVSMDPEANEKIEKIAAEQKLQREAAKAQAECDRPIETKRLADCLEDAQAAWKEAFWEEKEEVEPGYFIDAQHSIEPRPEAIALLARVLYERRH
ncbi:hypothetical protein KAR91_62025 [Candidatus Pacearchaeota archaeon]|nr:hypothetical protein [Candidatus Pacearchaeota archaeon]